MVSFSDEQNTFNTSIEKEGNAKIEEDRKLETTKEEVEVKTEIDTEDTKTEETKRLEDLKAEFILAVKNRNVKDVIRILEDNQENKEAIINSQDKDGNTAAHYCITITYSNELFNVLIESEADFSIPNNHDSGKKTPLHIAVLNNTKDYFMKLLEADVVNKECMINAMDRWCRTAAHILIIENKCSDDVLDALIKANADFNIKGKGGKTAFQFILDKGVSTKNLKKLLDAGADHEARDKDGKTAACRLEEAKKIIIR